MLPRLTDEQRELAICKASDLIELFHSESRCMYALWKRYGDFDSKAAYDLAYSNAHKARELMESLIRGRSPAYVAFLEKQRGLDLPACANEEMTK